MGSTKPSTNGATSAKQILRSFGITSEHLGAIAELGRRPEVSPSELVAGFYRWLDSQPWKAAFFADGVPERVRTAQIEYWREFLTGTVDDAYVASRFFVGATHARIGLPPKAYTTAMAFSQRWLVRTVREAHLSAEDTTTAVEAISILCQLDAALVMDAYADHSNQRIQAEADKLAAINNEVTRVMVAASEGDYKERYRAQGAKDAKLAEAVNQMIESLEGTIRQARAVAAGDYATVMTPRSDKDELGRVLAEMTARLREVTERRKRDRWLKQGQADVFERMRGERTISDVSREVLRYLAERLGAAAGCVYCPADDGALMLAATYGIAPDAIRSRLSAGEGITGEVAAKHKPRFDVDISANPIRSSYGLGDLVLNHLAVVPLVASDQLSGVLQLASVAPMHSEHREFLELVAENFAIGLGGAVSRAKMQALLDASQAQRNELERQAEQLQSSNDELEQRGRALQRAREDLQAQNAELEESQDSIERAGRELEMRAKELEVASKYKSEFLANMSHELRTPLHSMLILAENLCEDAADPLSDKQQEALEIIRAGGKDLLGIINDILDLSKVEAGMLSVQSQAVSLQEVVVALRQQFEPIAVRGGVELALSIDPRCPQTVDSDGQRLRQVLKNLVSNALKFTPEGSVTLRVAPVGDAPMIRNPALRAAPAVAFSVTDTGVGIPKDKLAAIFEAFQQADGSTSRQFGGTGLGLTISRQLAKLLGGELHVDSVEGEGSTFTFVLPVARRTPLAPDAPGAPADGEMSATPEHAPSPGRPSVLVVEDDAAFSEIMCNLVRARGYEATATASGKEALLLAERVAPQGIVLDLGLPDMDGLAVLEQLKHNMRTRHIPVHVVSGHWCRPDSLQLGAIGFLHKPAERGHLEGIFERFERLWTRETGRVLVVEDDAASQAVIADTLGARDVTIAFASTGSEGLDRLARERYDCVVVDLGLPDMEGADFLDRLPEDPSSCCRLHCDRAQ